MGNELFEPKPWQLEQVLETLCGCHWAIGGSWIPLAFGSINPLEGYGARIALKSPSEAEAELSEMAADGMWGVLAWGVLGTS